MRREWREQIKAAISEVEWLDPTTHGFEDPTDYVHWDLEALRSSDFIFAYLEAINPIGYNLTFELGVAYDRHIPGVFVNEKFADSPRAVSMLNECFQTCTTFTETL